MAFLGVFLALAGALAGLWLASGQQAEAQEPPLTLPDFDATGLDVEMAVLIQADSAISGDLLWARGRFGDAGTLLDGGTNGNIPMVSPPAHPDDPTHTEGNLIRLRKNGSGGITINEDGTLTPSIYFDSIYAGYTLRIYFQTAAAGVAYTNISDPGVLGDRGGGYAAFNLNSATAAIAQGIEGDERFIFALARALPNSPPDFDAETATRSVLENSAAGTAVGAAITATDADTGATITYTLSGSTLFTVTSSGQIQVASGASLDHEDNDSHTVTLTATDNHGATDTIEVTISVGDVNEAPEFDDTTVTLAVAENSAAGANVGSPLGFEDPDDWDSVTLTDNSAEFNVTGSGQVQVASGASLDHEDTDKYTFTVTATDSRNLTDTVRVTVSVTDVAEPPRLSPAPGTLPRTVNTNQEFTFTDTDGLSQIRVSRSNGTGRVVLGTAEAGLSCSRNVTAVQVTPGAPVWVRWCATGTVTLRVADAADATNFTDYNLTVREQPNRAPAFDSDATTRSVNENLPSGANVGAVVTATDPDRDPLAYSITGSNPGGFTVTSGGQVQTGTALDHEATDSYTVTLRAQDPDGLADTIQVTISVGDVNEAPVFGADTTTRTVPENSAAGANAGAAVAAADQDGDNLVYTLAGSTLITIVSGGQVQVAAGAVLDFESDTTSYTATVTATDPGGLSDSIVVTIRVTNVNESPVMPASRTFTVNENLAEGSDVGAPVTGADPDGDDLAYSISGAPEFRVVSSSGQIRVAAGGVLDYETIPSYTMTVTGRDPGGLSASTRVTIVLTDVYENVPPVFLEEAPAARSVAENSPAGTNVGDPVTAVDAGDTLVYSLGGADAALFTIVAFTGQVQVGPGAPLDYETRSSYGVTVTATDSEGGAASIEVSITVTDVTNQIGLSNLRAASGTVTVAELPTGNSPIPYFLRYRAPDGEWSAVQAALSAAGSVTFDLTGLSPATTYEANVSREGNFPADSTTSVRFTTLPAGGIPPAPRVTQSAIAVQGQSVTLTFGGFVAGLEAQAPSDGRLALTRLYQGLCNTDQTYTGPNNLGQQVANVPFSRAGWRDLGERLAATGFTHTISYPDYTPDCFLAFYRYGQSDGTTILSDPLLLRVDWQRPRVVTEDALGRSPMQILKARTPGGSPMILFLTPLVLFGVIFGGVRQVYKQAAVYVGLGGATLGMLGAVLLLDMNYFALLLLLIPPVLGFIYGRASR